MGIEPTHNGFANHCLTTWLLRRALGAGGVDYALVLRVSMPGFCEIWDHTLLRDVSAVF